MNKFERKAYLAYRFPFILIGIYTIFRVGGLILSWLTRFAEQVVSWLAAL